MNTITLTDSFRTVCAGEIENFERIRDEQFPDAEMLKFDDMTSKEKFEFAYAKALKGMRENKAVVRSLEQEIKELKSNDHWWNKNGTKADSKEARNLENSAVLKAMFVWFARKLMSKLDVIDDPGPWRQPTPQELNEMIVTDREMRLANALEQIADKKDIGYKELAREGVILMDQALEKWKNRPEAHDAKRQIVAIKSLLDADEFAERVAELPDADKEKLIADIAGHDPCGAVKTLAAGENHAADIREQERQKAKEAENSQDREQSDVPNPDAEKPDHPKKKRTGYEP